MCTTVTASLLHRQQKRQISEVSTVHACSAFVVNAHCLFTSLSLVYINRAVIIIFVYYIFGVTAVCQRC